MSGESEISTGARELSAVPTPGRARQAGFAAAALAAATAAALLLRPHATPPDLVAVYLLAVLAVAVRCERPVSVVTSFVSVAAFDFFCVPPYLTLRISQYGDLITFAGMLAVSLVISAQTARIRAQADEAAAREAQTAALYQLARLLAGQTRTFDVIRTAADLAGKAARARVVIFVPEEGAIDFGRRSSEWLPVPKAEEKAAQWVLDRARNAGRGTPQFADSAAVYIPMKGAREMAGVMAALPEEGDVLADAQVAMLELFATQIALAIERTQSQNAAESARIRMQTEQMRSSLLSAVSHDLRTPLASITGAASTLRQQGDRLDLRTRQDLLESIAEEAERLGRIVGNLLDMTRLESGVELRRELYPLEEIVGAALQRMDAQLAGRKVITAIPEELPLVFADDVLLGQLVGNLIENAAKYTPSGAEIEVAAEAHEGCVMLEVRDRGPGIPDGEQDRIFEKFYRGRSAGSRGAGLGLAICRAIAEAHRGSIKAFNRQGGGAVFRVVLPLEKAQ